MTLSMSISAGQSSVVPFQSKPMAISSITSPPNASLETTSPLSGSSSSSSSSSSSDISSPPISSNNQNNNKIVGHSSSSASHHFPSYHHPHSSNSSSPESIHSTAEVEAFYRSSSYLQQYHHDHHPHTSNYTTISRTDYRSSLPPLSLQERRQRNKAASAKYRAKKNQQQGEMRTLISSLTKENELLQRQVDNVRRENNRLKTTCDQLRGKMLAEKMLKKLLDEEGMERFDEDIDFEDDEDENELLWKQKHDIN